MKQSMKKKMVAVSVTAATLMGGMMFAASANAEEVQFVTKLHVISSNECELNIDLPSQTGSVFSATWSKINGGIATMTLDSDSAPTDDAVVGVRVSDDSPDSCSLSSVKLEAEANAGEATGVRGVMIGAEGGAYWRFEPTLANVLAYSSNDYTSAISGLQVITPVATVTPTTTVQQTRGGSGTLSAANSKTVFGAASAVSYLSLVDSYVGMAAPLVANGMTGVNTLVVPNAQVAKSVKFYIGGYIAASPTDLVGNIDEALPVNGDDVSLPFTVVVTNA